MSDRLRCRLCGLTMTVSEADPDATVEDMVGHTVMRHAADPLLGDPKVIELVTDRTVGASET